MEIVFCGKETSVSSFSRLKCTPLSLRPCEIHLPVCSCTGKEGKQAAFQKQFWRREELYMGIFDPDKVITIYSLREAVTDGAVVEVFKDEWGELSRGKPIAASINVYEDESPEALVEIWNRFVFWRKFVFGKLPENERIFSTEIDYRTIWVIDYKAFFMMMYPEEY
jgi:hypothetical protein